jgi:hypothetical protein
MKFEQPQLAQQAICKNPTQFVKVNNTEYPLGHFVEVNINHPLFPRVKDLLNQIIAPIYGDVTKFLDKIGEAKDRTCQLLMKGGEIVGVLVYKLEPNNDSGELGGGKSY